MDISLKAREYAFLLLKYRLRSEKEIRDRLRRKKFPENIIRETVLFLKEKKFLDDKVFARVWINSRLKKPLGLRRIRQELKVKGIEEEIINHRIGEARKSYPESEVIELLALARIAKQKGVEPVKARNRTFAYLIRRGFSPEIIAEVLGKICRQTS